MKTTEIPDFFEIDKKQQKLWEDNNDFKTPEKPGDKKFYCLDMFPYPSGDGLHVGHPEGYTASDIVCRYKRMRGYSVLHPMGWDAFGLPAENYAISTGVHPEITTQKNITNFKRQIKSLGFSYDWTREINTTSPGYFRWTQWIFLQLFKKGLAYEATVPINWCPKCKTGLANEEVFQGKCDRCETPIERKSLRQWMLKITAYADRLLSDLEGLDWPSSTMHMQKNWIGRSEGAEIKFAVENSQEAFIVFTTRPDTIYGATYMVLSPEHPALLKITKPEKLNEVKAYVASAANKSDIERAELDKEKTGVFTGAYALNPLNGTKIPVWTADYVMMTYGTGAIMAVPAHDERDWEFAKKYNLPILRVVGPANAGETPEGVFCEDGIAINSEIINGLKTPDAVKKMTTVLSERGLGTAKVNFKLRDWVFSRQRYWGEPIPLIHCAKCGIVPVPENQLPVTLPQLEKFQPTGTGESPLAAIDSWVNTTCPQCGGPGKRETNTMPQWAGSCWYYLRFIDPNNDKAFVSKELEKSWAPVDLYIGGAEHAVLHLLYARFWHKVLFDLGFVTEKEPFKKLVHQGMILSYSYRDSKGVYRNYNELEIKEAGLAITKEGEEIKPVVEKMSKSKKNVINPDEIVSRYGADSFRMYEMFMGPLEDSKPWDMRGIEGIHRFLKRVWVWAATDETAIEDKELTLLRNQTIAKVTDDYENLKFNTAISALMIYLNKLNEKQSRTAADFEAFMTLLHPMAPHITDELWALNGQKGTLMAKSWPQADAGVLASRTLEIPVQINGKVKTKIHAAENTGGKALEKMALENAAQHLAGKTVVKIIVVPNRLVSIVVR